MLRPTIFPRVSQTIPEIIQMIQGLIDKGHAYATPSGDVYFRVRTDPDYGKLSHRRWTKPSRARVWRAARRSKTRGFRPLEGGQARRAELGQPLGRGPARLAHRVLGHEPDVTWASRSTSMAAATTWSSRITRTRSPRPRATPARPFARYWMHNGMLQLKGEKMSKSLGNLVTIDEFLART